MQASTTNNSAGKTSMQIALENAKVKKVVKATKKDTPPVEQTIEGMVVNFINEFTKKNPSTAGNIKEACNSFMTLVKNPSMLSALMSEESTGKDEPAPEVPVAGSLRNIPSEQKDNVLALSSASSFTGEAEKENESSPEEKENSPDSEQEEEKEELTDKEVVESFLDMFSTKRK